MHILAPQKNESFDELLKRPAPAMLWPPTACTRCGGFMVREVCIDPANNTSELESTASRCVQCGDLVDVVILRNRHIYQESTAIPSTNRIKTASGSSAGIVAKHP